MAKTDTTVDVRLRSLERLTVSAAGNPRWQLTWEGGEAKTWPNASVSYGIDNGHPVGKVVRLTLDVRGYVVDLEILHP